MALSMEASHILEAAFRVAKADYYLVILQPNLLKPHLDDAVQTLIDGEQRYKILKGEAVVMRTYDVLFNAGASRR